MTEANHQFSIGFINSSKDKSFSEQIQGIINSSESSIDHSFDSSTSKSINSTATVEDIDGNLYETIRIGNQVWMSENLRTTRLNNGTPIPEIANGEEWSQTTSPAFCKFKPTCSTDAFRGNILYNAYAANHEKLCPPGWRVATDDDWKQLESFIGLPQEELDKADWRGDIAGLLAGEKSLWVEGELKKHASFGKTKFQALPTGNRIGSSGTFGNAGTNSYFWTATQNGEAAQWTRMLYYGSNHMIRKVSDKNVGMAIRCVKE